MGYSTVPGFGYVTEAAALGPFPSPSGSSISTLNAGVVVRARTTGSDRAHVLAGFGYYDQATRVHYSSGPDAVEHERRPGFSFGVGGSVAGFLRPGFQLRWRHLLRPEADYLPYIEKDEVSFEAGVHFN